jgi:hypothetical protein
MGSPGNSAQDTEQESGYLSPIEQNKSKESIGVSKITSTAMLRAAAFAFGQADFAAQPSDLELTGRGLVLKMPL